MSHRKTIAFPIDHFFNFFDVFPPTKVDSQLLTNTVHKTQAAAEKMNDMWCYSCHSMENGDVCIENITANYSSFMKKCKDDELTCMVQKFSYTTSTENATSSPRMWSLERKCASNCESGCIVIGERTKLYACTSCCRTSYCNTGKGSANTRMRASTLAIIIVGALVSCSASTALTAFTFTRYRRII